MKKGEIFLVDYDIPYNSDSETKRLHRQFYRKLSKLLKEWGIYDFKRSTLSVFFTPNRSLAEEVYNLAREYGNASMYKAKLIKSPRMEEKEEIKARKLSEFLEEEEEEEKE